MAVTAEAAEGRATWRLAQALVTQARDAGAAPVLRALVERGAGLCWLSYWGMVFTPKAIGELEADPGFLAAMGRGEVGMLAEVMDAPPRGPDGPQAPPWIVALVSAGRLPMFLPPLVHEVTLTLRAGGRARYIFTRPIYAMAPAVPPAANS